jgi:hypothetical protein
MILSRTSRLIMKRLRSVIPACSRLQPAAVVLLMLAIPCLGAPPGADPKASFDLFTASEAAEWNSVAAKPDAAFGSRDFAQPGVPNCHSATEGAALAAGAPQIKIVTPSTDQPLRAPIDIDLQFIPAGDVAIKPETFRVCYMGFVTIDITKRITDRVTVSAQGIRVNGAQLPHGHHHLTMLIADAQGRLGRREAQFDID